jgi:hypothetical protein
MSQFIDSYLNFLEQNLYAHQYQVFMLRNFNVPMTGLMAWHFQILTTTKTKKKKKKSVACSPQANYTDRAAAAC